MEGVGTPVAPELIVDDKTERGFVNWFRSLQQVGGKHSATIPPSFSRSTRGYLLVSIRPNLRYFLSLCMMFAGLQVPSLIRFFDRKVSFVAGHMSE